MFRNYSCSKFLINGIALKNEGLRFVVFKYMRHYFLEILLEVKTCDVSGHFTYVFPVTDTHIAIFHLPIIAYITQPKPIV